MYRKITVVILLAMVMLITGCDLFKVEETEIVFEVANHVFLDETLRVDSELDDLTYNIVGDNEINAKIIDGKIYADKPGVIQIAAIYKGKQSEPRIVYVLQKDEAVTEVVLSADLLKMDLGKIYSFGLDLLPKDAYKVESSNESILKVLDNNNIEIVGSGRGELKITNNLTNTVIYDDIFVVYNSILLTEIKTQLLKEQAISSMNNDVTQEHFDLITDLDLSRKLSNDSSVALGVKYLKNLESLNLSDNGLTDISFIQILTNLESLDLSNNQIEDLSPLNNLSNLETVNLSNNKISNISTLRRHQKVVDLNLSHNNILDLSPISTLYDLETLFIGNNPIDSIDHISALIKIKKLDVSYSQMIAEDIFGLDYFENLEYIDLSGLNLSLTNIPKTLPYLEVLKLNEVGLTGADLLHVLNYNKLNVLEIDRNDLDLIAVENFTRKAKESNSLMQIETLSMGYNNFVSLPDLSVFPKLKNLRLVGSKNLMELDNLSRLPYLETLDLSYTQSIENNEGLIEVFTKLEGLKKLSVVDGMNYFDRSLFDYFTQRVTDHETFSIEIFKDEWMNKNTVYNYAKIVYFSIEEFMEHLTTSGDSYKYVYQSNQRNIILNLINDTSAVQMNIIIPKDVFEVNIYSNKLKKLGITFEVEERRQSIIQFNLFNFKTNGGSNFSAIKTHGEAELRITYSGENELIGGFNKNGIEGYNVFIKPYSTKDTLSIRGGQGAKGADTPKSDKSKDDRKGGTGEIGKSGILAVSVNLEGAITITGGKGGAGGRGGDRQSYGILGRDGDGGNGGNGGRGGSAIHATTIIKTDNVILFGGNGGDPGTGGKGAGLFYSDGSVGSVGSVGPEISS